VSATKVLCASYPAQRESVPRIRHELTEVAALMGASQEQTDMLALAVTEAATNVVVHAYGESGGELHVTAALLESALSLVIADDGRGLGQSPNKQGLGLGFRLIEASADQLKVAPRPSGGVEITLRFDLQPLTKRQIRCLQRLPDDHELVSIDNGSPIVRGRRGEWFQVTANGRCVAIVEPVRSYVDVQG
jgi:serine/threonine-protein kinase RsbW